LILPNASIGDGAVTVVMWNVPPNTLWGIPNAEPLARITVLLTIGHSYEDFVKELHQLEGRRNLLTSIDNLIL